MTRKEYRMAKRRMTLFTVKKLLSKIEIKEAKKLIIDTINFDIKYNKF